MRRIVLCALALATVLGTGVAARATDGTTTTVSRTERISYPARGCRREVRFHERYHLDFGSTEYPDGSYRWHRVMRGRVRFREDGRRFVGRFVQRERTVALEDPGTYTVRHRMRASARDGTTLVVRGHERDLVWNDGGPPDVLERTLERSCR